MATKKNQYARVILEPDYEVELPCGCVHTKRNKVFKVKYCRRKRILYPLATGVVKTVEKKVELYHRLGMVYDPKTRKAKRIPRTVER